jgi:hypothetical protein
MRKRILCLDFDGVIHAYTSGWQGAANIPDPPVPGAIEFLRAAVEHFSVAVFSSRSHQPGGIAAMQAWLAEWAARELPPGADLAFLEQLVWPLEKPLAFVTLDDRALTFTGEWPSLEALQAFRPWYQRRAQE